MLDYIGTKIDVFVDIYNFHTNTFYRRLYSSNEPIWLTQGCPNHLLNVIAHIVDTFAETPNMVPLNERYDK